jgi:hypothetical protein
MLLNGFGGARDAEQYGWAAQRGSGGGFLAVIEEEGFDMRVPGEDADEFGAAIAAVAGDSGALLCINIHSNE